MLEVSFLDWRKIGEVRFADGRCAGSFVLAASL
jgi:hypothetical protein